MKTRKVSIGVGAVAMVIALLACSGSVSTANVAEAWMSADEAGEVRTTSYGPDAVIYAQADLRNAPEDTLIRAVWTAVEAVDVEPGMVISESELTTGSGVVYFTLTNDGPWPTGAYRVEIFVNAERVQTLDFTVE